MRQLLDEHAAQVLGSGTATAAAVAVTDPDRTLIACSYGAADDALWPIASVGKAFAAVIALQLAEEGALDLHAPVQESLPWFSVRSRYGPITLHHLLTHSSGLIESSDRAPASGCSARTGSTAASASR
jgi:CubicO group peptidase (beta-lactamase class C family)